MNRIQAENAHPGTTSWHLTNPATLREIEGYCSATSVNVGGSIDFHISSDEADYAIDVYRMGWYGGDGGRLLTSVTKSNGSVQTMPTAEADTKKVACPWTSKHTLAVPSWWTSGRYLAKLTQTTSGKQAYLIFDVRDDARTAHILYESPYNTYQAYNKWGGASLYGHQSAGTTGDPDFGITFSRTGQAHKVSYDRPYYVDEGTSRTGDVWLGLGAGDFVTHQDSPTHLSSGWEIDAVQWLEKEGYDVKYATDVDVHADPSILLGAEVLFTAGHNEYWSLEMRNGWIAARDAGIHLMVLGSNTAYWQIRFEDSNRTIVAYKEDVGLDPETDPNLKTNLWWVGGSGRDARPEGEWLGGMWDGYFPNGFIAPGFVRNPSHALWAGSGVTLDQQINGICGYEWDRKYGVDPPDADILLEYDVNGDATAFYHTTVYTDGVSGAVVFNAGSNQYAWCLHSNALLVPGERSSYEAAAIQTLTTNALTAMGQAPGDNPAGREFQHEIDPSGGGSDWELFQDWTPDPEIFAAGYPAGTTRLRVRQRDVTNPLNVSPWREIEVNYLTGGATGTGAISLPAWTAGGAGVVAVEGAAGISLPAFTSVAAGVVSVVGAGAATMPSLTSTGAGVVAVAGSGAATLPAWTAAGVVAVQIAGSGASILPAFTAAGVGGAAILGAGGATLPAFTATAAGVVDVAGAAAISLPALTSAGVGAVAIVGSSAAVLPALQGAGSGTALAEGTGVGHSVLPAFTATGAGVVSVAGSGVALLPSLTSSAAGTVAVVGSGASTLPAFATSAAGAVAVVGSGAAVLPAFVAAGTGSSQEQTTGAGAVVLPALAGSGAGTVAVRASGSASLPALVSSGAGVITIVGAGGAILPAMTSQGTVQVLVVGIGGIILPAFQAAGYQTGPPVFETIRLPLEFTRSFRTELEFKRAVSGSLEFARTIEHELEV